MNETRTISRAGASQAVVGVLCCSLLAACGSSSGQQNAVEHGKQLFESKALSTSKLNDYACVTCHDTEAVDPPSKKTGAPLSGVTLRSQFWGGQEVELLRSVNACRNYFMLDAVPLRATDADARALYAYLESLEPGDDATQPFTIVTQIDRLPPGDELQGQVLYAEACATCHGSMHDGSGRLSAQVPVLPEDTLAEPTHATFTPNTMRLVFTEKIRHGLFLGYSGEMPPFSAERLSNQDVSDLLQGLGVLGE